MRCLALNASFEPLTLVQVRRALRLVIEGKGNGHGVGMCQWGAVGRARAGYSAEQILSAYYPGTTLSKMY